MGRFPRPHYEFITKSAIYGVLFIAVGVTGSVLWLIVSVVLAALR